MKSAAGTVLSEPDTVPIAVAVEGAGEDTEGVLESQLENPTQWQAEIPPHRLSHLGPLHGSRGPCSACSVPSALMNRNRTRGRRRGGRGEPWAMGHEPWRGSP